MLDETDIPINNVWQTKQILKINSDSYNGLRYELNINELQKILESVGDMELAVIPVVWQCDNPAVRTFILNCMMRFLSDPQNDEWIDRSDEPLRGFEVMTDSGICTEAQTSGIWLSKPFIVKRIDGKELAVILMDTQSMFDSRHSVRDSSAIFWISSLISSTLTINVSTQLSEDLLTKLATYLLICFLHTSESGSDNSPFIDSLTFLILDWNSSDNYGFNGGMDYLNSILENNSLEKETQRILKNIKEINCFLMPYFETKVIREEFNSSVNQSEDNFVKHLKQFISTKLDINKLKPKIYSNKAIIGKELVFYIQTYIELFNNKEPNPTDIIAATTKAKGLITIDSVKKSHFKGLETFILSKDFVSRKELNDYQERLIIESKEQCCFDKMSKFWDVMQELNKILESNLELNYIDIYETNELRRKQFMEGVIVECSSMFKNKLKDICNQMIEPNKLKNLISTIHKTIMETFVEAFGNEEESVFVDEKEKVKKRIVQLTEQFIFDDNKRKLEAEENNLKAIQNSINEYKIQMQLKLEENQYLNDEDFNQFEFEVKTFCRRKFIKESIFGYLEFFNEFDTKFRQQLIHLMIIYKHKNQRKNDSLIGDNEIDLIDSFDEFIDKFDKSLDTIKSGQEFIQRLNKLKEEILNEKRNEIKNELFDIFEEKFTKNIQNYCQTKIDYMREKFIEKNKLITEASKSELIEILDQYLKDNYLEFNANTKMEIVNNFFCQFESKLSSEFGINYQHFIQEMKDFSEVVFKTFKTKQKDILLKLALIYDANMKTSITEEITKTVSDINDFNLIISTFNKLHEKSFGIFNNNFKNTGSHGTNDSDREQDQIKKKAEIFIEERKNVYLSILRNIDSYSKDVKSLLKVESNLSEIINNSDKLIERFSTFVELDDQELSKFIEMNVNTVFAQQFVTFYTNIQIPKFKKKVEKINKLLKTLRIDGNEEKLIEMNKMIITIRKELKIIDDLKGEKFEKTKLVNQEFIKKIDQCSKFLLQISMGNVIQLINDKNQLDTSHIYAKLFNEIESSLEKNPTIEKLDEYRKQLQQINKF